MVWSKVNSLWEEAVAKASLNRAKVSCCRPETRRPIHGQAEVSLIGNGGPNPRTLKSAGMNCG